MRAARKSSSYSGGKPTNGQPRHAASTLRNLTEEILEQEAMLRHGGPPSGHQRQAKLGRLSVRERLDLLLDQGARFLELNLWAAWQLYPQFGEVPGAGIVTGIGFVQGRPIMVIANDATVKAGAFFPATCKKVIRAQKIAARCNLSIVYLVDSAGVFLPLQDEIFPDEDDFGRIFRNNAVLSAMGIPQFAAVMGNCVAGGAYLPVLCDKLLMVEGSEMYLAGPALVRAAIGQQVDPQELGGAAMHARTSGTADFLEKDDRSCLARLRELIALLPEVGCTSAHQKREARSEKRDVKAEARRHAGTKARSDELATGNLQLATSSIYDVASADHHKEYDVRDLLAQIVDPQSLIEYKAEYGKTLVCAYAAIGGHRVGIVASQRTRCKSAAGEVQIGGVIYPDSADKAARFVMDCNQSRPPLVFFQDVVGFMVGREAEQHGIIRCGAKLVNAVSNSIVPKITVIIGGSFGAGNYALCGKAFDPVFVFAWPGARYAVMGAEQAAETLAALEQRQHERGGKRLSEDQRHHLRENVKTNYEQQADIRYGAARGWIDAIIPPHATRQVLIEALSLVQRPAPAGSMPLGVFQV